jgi:hypothetical protein
LILFPVFAPANVNISIFGENFHVLLFVIFHPLVSRSIRYLESSRFHPHLLHIHMYLSVV